MKLGQSYLPDPSTPGGGSGALANTDDLLSKLAGDEIDKLLAEADVDRPADTAPAVSAQAASKVDDDLSSQIDQLLEEKKAAPVAAPPIEAVAPVGPPIDAAEEARLKTLAKELEVDEPAPAVSETEMDEEEADRDEDAAVAEDGEEPFDIFDRPLPTWLRPLEWISSPLETAPDWVRPVMGKVAIVTMLNALAVIGYVIFRKHH